MWCEAGNSYEWVFHAHWSAVFKESRETSGRRFSGGGKFRLFVCAVAEEHEKHIFLKGVPSKLGRRKTAGIVRME